MLKDALRDYLDLYAECWEKEFGHPPMVDAEITEEPSICFVGEADDEGYIQWKYVEQPDPIDFDAIENQYQIHVCEDVKQLYNSYIFLELQGFLDGQRVHFDPVTDETKDLFFPSDDAPPIDQYPHLVIIGLYGPMDVSLCVDIVTGKVYSWDLDDYTYEYENEDRYKDPELIADSLTDLLTRLTPMKQ